MNNKIYSLRTKNKNNKNNDIGLPIDETPYESLNTEDIDSLSQGFSGLNIRSQRENRAINALASMYVDYSANTPDETNLALLAQVVSEAQVVRIPVTNNTNTKNLLTNLLICLTRLPLIILCMIQEKSPEVLKILTKQFISLLRLIILIILTLSQSVLGIVILLLFMCVIYQTQWGYATIQFCFGTFLYLYKSFPANLGIDWVIEQIKGYALAWLALIMHGPVDQIITWGTSILSSISTSAETIAQAAETTQLAADSVKLMTDNMPNQLIMALNSPEGRLAIKQAVESSAIMGGLALAWENQQIFYDQQLLPELNKIGNVLTSASNNIEDVKLITQDVSEDIKGIKEIVIQDLNTINELIDRIQNNQQLTSVQLKEILKLVQQNLQTTDLGRLISANGLTPDTIIGFLTATQQNLARLMGRQQLLLNNGEVGGTRKKRNFNSKKNKNRTKKRQNRKKIRKYKSIKKYKQKDKKKSKTKSKKQ